MWRRENRTSDDIGPTAEATADRRRRIPVTIARRGGADGETARRSCRGARVSALSARGPRYDVVIRGGQLIDGTGASRVAGDVAIADGRIVAVGRVPDAPAARVIDGRGLIVAPGFIPACRRSPWRRDASTPL